MAQQGSNVNLPDVIQKYVEEAVNFVNNPDVNLHVYETCKFDPDHDPDFGPCNYVLFKLWGGLNGCGSWSNYFKSLSMLIDTLSIRNVWCWLVEIENDCVDDVFYAKFGAKFYKS